MSGRLTAMTAAAAAFLWTNAAVASGSLAPSSGEMAQHATNTFSGSYSLKLDHKFKLELDGLYGRLHHDTVSSWGEHIFWRDKKIGLVGFDTNYTHYSHALTDERYGMQGALYLLHLDLEAKAGWERDNIDESLYDSINANYFPIDDARIFAGQRQTHGKDSAAFGGEYLLPIAGVHAAPFAEGRAGNKSQTGIWVGIRFYFGSDDDTLIDMQRDGDLVSDPVDGIFNPDLGAPGPHDHNPTPCPTYMIGTSALIALLSQLMQ